MPKTKTYKTKPKTKPSKPTKYIPKQTEYKKSKYSKSGKRPYVKRTGESKIDATVAPLISYQHGRPMRIDPYFRKKVMDAMTAINSRTYITPVQTSSVYDSTAFTMSANLYDPAQMRDVGNQIANVNVSSFVVRDTNMDIQIVNQSTGSAFLRCYECVFREDTPYTATYNSPLANLIQGLTDAGTTNVYSLPVTVFQSPAFVQHYKVEHVRVLQFRPGESRVINVSDNNPFNVRIDRFYENNTLLLDGIRGRTRFIIFQQWGQLGDDAATTNIVATIPTKFNFITTTRINWGYSVDSLNTNTQTSSLSVIPTTTTTQIVSDVSGVVLVPATA